METTWLVINPGSHYHDACLSKSLCNTHQFLVVGWGKWIHWYNASMNYGIRQTPPPPAFVGDTYEIAKSVADELNNKQTTEGINK
jgi:hypothetical protein